MFKINSHQKLSPGHLTSKSDLSSTTKCDQIHNNLVTPSAAVKIKLGLRDDFAEHLSQT